LRKILLFQRICKGFVKGEENVFLPNPVPTEELTMTTTMTSLRASVLSMVALARTAGGRPATADETGWQVEITPGHRVAIVFTYGQDGDFVQFRSSRKGRLVRLDGDVSGRRVRTERVYDTELSNAQLLQLFGWVTCRATMPGVPTDDELRALEVSLEHKHQQD
jgi:hypothetical protein